MVESLTKQVGRSRPDSRTDDFSIAPGAARKSLRNLRFVRTAGKGWVDFSGVTPNPLRRKIHLLRPLFGTDNPKQIFPMAQRKKTFKKVY